MHLECSLPEDGRLFAVTLFLVLYLEQRLACESCRTCSCRSRVSFITERVRFHLVRQRRLVIQLAGVARLNLSSAVCLWPSDWASFSFLPKRRSGTCKNGLLSVL